MTYQEIKRAIAGEIALSSDPGATMKKWRELFGINQSELAGYLDITPSTVSDYENNRRRSPGIGVVKRFADALVEIDKKRGGNTIKKLVRQRDEDIYEIHDFPKPINAKEFVKAVDGKIITNKRRVSDIFIYGYTIVDSIKAIMNLGVDEFYKIYGTNPSRAIIFTKVQLGRSPMVAIRVSSIKPSLVVYQGLSDVSDMVARKISEVERIPMVVTRRSVDEIKEKLGRFE